MLFNVPKFSQKLKTVNDLNLNSNLAFNKKTNRKINWELEGKQNWLDAKSDIGEFVGNIKDPISGAVDGALDIGLNLLGKKKDALDAPINTIADIAGNFGPWGQVAKWGLKGLNFADKALGKTTNDLALNTGLKGRGL